jgi:hypothetical protein
MRTRQYRRALYVRFASERSEGGRLQRAHAAAASADSFAPSTQLVLPRVPEVVEFAQPDAAALASRLSARRFIVHTDPALPVADAVRSSLSAAAACGGKVSSVQPFACHTAIVEAPAGEEGTTPSGAPQGDFRQSRAKESAEAGVQLSPLERIAAVPGIRKVEPDIRMHFARQATPWGMAKIRAPATRTRRVIRGVNADVFVLDTGVARNHRDLNVVEARSFVSWDRSPWDTNGHGTAVAGVIGARDNGVDVVGVAPGVRIRSLKVLDGEGNGMLSDIVAAVEHMIRWKRSMGLRVRNAVVANLSLGGYVGSAQYTALDVALQAAVRAGITVVVAAGNEGEDATLYTPAHAREVLAVGSSDENDLLSPWSNWGEPVRIHAPGSNVLTTYLNNRLARISGTSFAAPHVSGAAALYLARRRTARPEVAIQDLCTIAGGRNIGRVNNLGRPSTTTRRLDCVGL